jgi:hypothetical protein
MFNYPIQAALAADMQKTMIAQAEATRLARECRRLRRERRNAANREQLAANREQLAAHGRRQVLA